MLILILLVAALILAIVSVSPLNWPTLWISVVLLCIVEFVTKYPGGIHG
jgi:hypothetical protein